MDCRTGAFTTRVPWPLIDPTAAVMVVSPTPTPVANALLLIVATLVLEEVQVTPVVST